LKRQQKKAEADQKPNPGGGRVAARPQSRTLVLSKGRKLVFGLVAVVVLPLVFLGFLEIGLRLAGYGYSTGFFKRIRIGNEEFLVDNDKFGLRFFPPELSRIPAPVRMNARKPPGTPRTAAWRSVTRLDCLRPIARRKFPATSGFTSMFTLISMATIGLLELGRSTWRDSCQPRLRTGRPATGHRKRSVNDTWV
jgi:hypothetical protein